MFAVRLFISFLLSFALNTQVALAAQGDDFTIENLPEKLENLVIENPHFYRVERDGNVIHILGTSHTIFRLEHFPPVVMQTLLESDLLLTEMNYIQEEWQFNLYYETTFQSFWNHPKLEIDKPPLNNYSEAELKTLSEFGFPRKYVQHTDIDKPYSGRWGWAKIVYADWSMDNKIHAKAIANGIPHQALENDKIREDADTHAGVITEVELSKCVSDCDTLREDLDAILKSAFRRRDKKYATLMAVQSYLSVDPETDRMFEGGKDKESVYRNKHWLKTLDPILSSGTKAFVAVGAAHLYGKHGLLQELKRRGATVTRVMK